MRYDVDYTRTRTGTGTALTETRFANARKYRAKNHKSCDDL
jgi:hypothetical protein